ncbi:Retrovirus-related Pol polyprotein from transposon TNT 1-94 [Senna tora]|uniref:Retrovirus-related Pol polyprotein from transposon TNT 1-94 n=1 Tax=Senna tora TaxID=362788 RepID=A0A834XE15_9FABA|nr:Retrovirus-related Pol polyprotein from transposon TNT 1-94 [Senna tora]
MIGSLRYLTNCTRPDMSYAVGLLGRFTVNLKYPVVLEGYSDADWNTLSGDSLSTSGYIFTLGGCAICWKSKKQQIIAKSTMEDELIALALASDQGSWLIKGYVE